jgi:hypothetical protein
MDQRCNHPKEKLKPGPKFPSCDQSQTNHRNDEGSRRLQDHDHCSLLTVRRTVSEKQFTTVVGIPSNA